MYAQAISVAYSSAPYRESQANNILYTSVLLRGRKGLIWSGLTGRSRRLLSVEEVLKDCSIQARSSGGTRTVAISQICGSENRVGDFDCEFNPLQEHTRDRWLSIASAVQRGRYLPPVALIQVSERYFVRDGHHRISVARALGQQAIEAAVEVWQVAQPVAAKRRSSAPRPRRAGQWGAAPRPSIRRWLSGLLQPAGSTLSSPVAS